MSEWKEYKLGEIADIVGGGTPSTKETNYYGGSIAWLTPRDLTNYNKKFISRGERNITIDGLNNSSARLVPQNTILLTSRAPIGYLAISANEVCTNQGFKSIVVNSPVIDFNFVYYLLKANIDFIKSIGTGTTFAEVSASVVKNLKFKFPPLPTQQSIASILSSLDDKIELNNAINKNLEELAQALFKRWFVDFEFPFDFAQGKPNEEGLPYKSSGGEMVESELGMVPKGWVVGTYGEFARTTSGGTPSRKVDEYYNHGTIPWVKSKELNNSVILETEEKITDLGLKESSAKVLPPHSVLIAMYGATVGQIGLILSKASCNQAICAILPSESTPYTFNYLFMQNYRRHFENYAMGSAQQNISQKLIKSIKLIIPDLNKMKIFHSFAEPILKGIEVNCVINQELTMLRDTLLPKLISGELEVNEALAQTETSLP